MESATKEIGLWFGEEEVQGWRSATVEWVYEEEELEEEEAAAVPSTSSVEVGRVFKL